MPPAWKARPTLGTSGSRKRLSLAGWWTAPARPKHPAKKQPRANRRRELDPRDCGKACLATSGAKAQVHVIDLTAALKALRHPKSVFFRSLPVSSKKQA